MKRLLFLSFIFIVINFCNIYCQDNYGKTDNLCNGCFASIGIRDFTLSSSKEEIDAHLTLIDDEIQFLDSYYLIETIELDHKDYEITYYLNFQDGFLKDYHFKIKGNRELFFWTMSKLELDDEKAFSDFTNTKHKYSFFSKKESCKRYILLSRVAHDKEYIKGGVKAN